VREKKGLIEQFFKGVLSTLKVTTATDNINHKISLHMRKIKRMFIRSIFELFVFSVGVVFLLIGLVVLLSRSFPVEYVLLVFGAVTLYLALLVQKLK
jgi:hypothetical protein